jgi:hypothetical protein
MYSPAMLSRCSYHLLALSAILLSTACAPVPIRMPTEIKGPVGSSEEHTFIIPQQTTRDEVVERLGWSDMRLNDSRLFWGHWDLSTKGRALIGFVPMAPLVGEYSRWRIWTGHNILIEFDNNGIVASVREVEDRDLMQEFSSFIHAPGRTLRNASLLAQQSFTAGYDYRRQRQAPTRWGMASIHQGGLEFKAEKTGLRLFDIAYDRIASVELDPKSLTPTMMIWPDGTHTYSTEHRRPRLKLRLKEKTAWGTEVYILIDPPMFLAALKAITVQINTGRYPQNRKGFVTQQSNREPSAARTSPIVDQSNLERAGVRPGWLAMSWSISQTFKPGMPILTGVDIDLLTGNSLLGSADITVEIRNNNTNQVLATASQTVQVGFAGLLHPDFAQDIPVTVGETYVLYVPGSKDTFGWKYSGDTYPKGFSTITNRQRSTPHPNEDCLFQTYGRPAP